jgi:GNAT superfamily N-acetyltransferase
MKNIKFEFIESKNIYLIIPLLQLLNKNILEEVLKDRLDEMVKQNYLCIGICGLWILTKYYVGKHIELDNIMILPEYQSQNIGHVLMNWVALLLKKIIIICMDFRSSWGF